MSKFRFANLWALACLMISLNSAVFAQGARVNPSGAGEDADRDNPAARDRWFMQGRVGPKGKTPAELRWQAYQQKIQMRAARLASARKVSAVGSSGLAGLAPSGASWSPLGPAPLKSDPGSGQDYGFVSGRATSVVIDQADVTGNTVYLGAAYGGVWRSTNAGSLNTNPSNVTWNSLTDNQPTLAVGAIALQPCSASLANCDNVLHLSKTILVGTGEPNSAIDSYYGLGILRSVDGGSNWFLVSSANGTTNSFKGLGFSKIVFNTTAGKENNVVAAAGSTIGTEDGARVSGQISGPFVSTDSGASWAAAPIADGAFGGAVSPISATSLVFDANAGPSGTFYMAMRYHGIYSSTDGTSWTRLAAQPGPSGAGINSPTQCPTAASTNCPFYRGELAVVPGRNEIYAWYVDGGSNDQGIWRSTDGGGTWIKLNDTNIASCGDTDGCGTVQGFYDLELAAVPNGSTSTDLYAGARNLFKCTIGGTVMNSTCSGTGTSSFQNLTHVYNCSGHATVHPDQHGISSLLVGSSDVLYFASDGGIYRALDGFTGLLTNNCLTNQFDDLNGSLGSMTQFVSFSQDSSNSAVLLGGTQDNGSPATSQTNASWHSVNGGDGGYNEIDPANSSNWFTANTGISIQLCRSGTTCTEGAFTLVADSTTLGGDSGAFYTPYTLDPQNSSELLVGTCRLWRGSSTGTGFVSISPNFDAGLNTLCADPNTTVVNFVHAIAAGGPVGANGFSKVIYVGLAGLGPLVGTTPPGGRVFVTTDSGANSIQWSEITPPVNHATFYTIGDIVVDRSDASGATAFLALQGFGSSHVLKTSNANLGVSATWTDFSGSLPNAPSNSLLIDSSTNTLYVGTDVGVFSSPTSSPAWTEVGLAPSSGGAGYLPNVPVTKLRLFTGGGSKILRASTYGRGIWEFSTPAFTITAPATLTTYPGQTASFSGNLTSLFGYTGTVTLTCGTGAPGTCTPPAPIVLAANASVPFTVAASNATPSMFTFNIHGTDGTLTSDQAVVLNVVDFAISAPIPPTATANVPNFSNATNFQLTTQGQFTDAVTLTCSGLPAGAACNFSPSATLQPTTASPTSVSLAISTTTATPATSSIVTITAHDATNPEPSPKTQSLTLTTTANPDYALAVSNSPQTTTVLGSATFNGTITAANGYTGGSVTLSCGMGLNAPPSPCTAPAAPIALAAGGTASFMVTASNATVGSFNFNIHGTDGTNQHDVPVSLTVNADFHVPATVVTCTPVAAGGVSTCSISIGPDGQSTFANNVTYLCGTTGFPNLSSCTFNPVSLPAGSSGATVVLSIATTQAVAGLRPAGPYRPSVPLFAFWLSLPALGIVSLGIQRRSRKNMAWLAGTLLVIALISFLTACGGGSGGGGGGQSGTTKGTYTFQVIATSNGIAHNAAMTLTVN